jgi:putative MATE family efflux protein
MLCARHRDENMSMVRTAIAKAQIVKAHIARIKIAKIKIPKAQARVSRATPEALSDGVPEPVAAAPAKSHRPPPSLWWPILRFALPQGASAALQLLSGTVTAVYFGQLLGVSALAAASVFFPVFFLLISFLIGLISGGIVLVARAYGAGDMLAVKDVAGTTLCASVSLSLVMSIIGYAFVPELLGVMSTPADILASAIDYARITFVSLPAQIILLSYVFLLRGTGDAKTPFILMAVFFGISLLLMPALILGWGGLPKLGVTSAPWASIGATAISLPGLILYLRRKQHPLVLDGELIRRLRINREVIRPFLVIGIAGGIQATVASLAEVAVVTLVNSFGSNATAAYGAINQVIGYLVVPMQAVGLAASVMAAQAIGAKRLGQPHLIAQIAAIMNVLIGAVSVAGLLGFADGILSWFVTDATTSAVAERALRMMLWSYILTGISDVLAGVMRASGTVAWPTLISLGGIWLVQVPVAYLLAGTAGLDGVWMGYPAGFLAALLAQSAYYGLVWRARKIG